MVLYLLCSFPAQRSWVSLLSARSRVYRARSIRRPDRPEPCQPYSSLAGRDTRSRWSEDSTTPGAVHPSSSSPSTWEWPRGPQASEYGPPAAAAPRISVSRGFRHEPESCQSSSSRPPSGRDPPRGCRHGCRDESRRAERRTVPTAKPRLDRGNSLWWAANMNARP